MTTTAVGQRMPVAIDGGLLRAGTQSATFDHTQPETLLRNYLRLVRRARSQQRAPEISLRREDVEALASYLGITAEQVLHRLATLMGSTRTQRTTMLSVFASGALLIGLAGSAAASPGATGIDPGGAAEPGPSPTLAPSSQPNGETVAPVGVGTTPPASTATTPATDSPFTSRPSSVVSVPVGADRAPVVAPPEADVTPVDAARTTPSTVVAPGPSEPDVALVTPVVPTTAVPTTTVPVAVAEVVVPDAGERSIDRDELVFDPPPPSADEIEYGVDVIEQPPDTPPTTAPDDDVIPQELPPVDGDTVAVGDAPVPPTNP